VVPVVKQLLLQAEQLRDKLSAGARTFGDGSEVASQVGLTQLVLLQGERVLGRESIAHHSPAKVLPSNSMATAMERLGPWMNTVTTAVTMTHWPRVPVGLLPSELPVRAPVSLTKASGC
jgi:hypothetical protein